MDIRRRDVMAELVSQIRRSHKRNIALGEVLSKDEESIAEKIINHEELVANLQTLNTKLTNKISQQTNELIQLSHEMIEFKSIYEHRQYLEDENIQLRNALENLKWGFGLREEDLKRELRQYKSAAITLFESQLLAEETIKKSAVGLCGALDVVENLLADLPPQVSYKQEPPNAFQSLSIENYYKVNNRLVDNQSIEGSDMVSPDALNNASNMAISNGKNSYLSTSSSTSWSEEVDVWKSKAIGLEEDNNRLRELLAAAEERLMAYEDSGAGSSSVVDRNGGRSRGGQEEGGTR